ncbi:mucin-5AC [Microplitis demolitor]|uniref:mucin-5AC n=1 Tax=Microplitis demolitor TaxID=69319 RepID=UPI0004CDA610|nr:mucin-5AC [Microplitis demolitor]
MKVIIILSIATSVTLGSLEPDGYKPPHSAGQSDHYLPASLSSSSHRSILPNQGLTPESHYLPTSYQSPSQNVLPNSLYLPSSNIRSTAISSLSSAIPNSRVGNSIGVSGSSRGGPVVVAMPSMQYLPSHPSISPQNPSSSSRQYNALVHHPQNPATTTTTTTTTITTNLDHRISNPQGVTNTAHRPTLTSLHMSNRNAAAISSSQYLPPPPLPLSLPLPLPTSSSSSSSSSQTSSSTVSLLPTSKHSDTFIQSIPSPSSNYLPSVAGFKQNQYHGRIDQPSSTSTVTTSTSSSSSASATSSGISKTYLTPNKLSSSLSGFSSLSQNNQYTGGAVGAEGAGEASGAGVIGVVGLVGASSADGQPRQSNVLASGNINQPPGNYYPSSPIGYPDESFAGYDIHQPLAKYEFEYRVNDEYGNDYSHKESRNGDDSTQGVYTVLLPDGRKQIVHYTADQDGYKPKITYEESAAGYGQGGYQY